MELRTAASPRDVKHYTTERLREEFLIDDLFLPDVIKLVYSHIDRIITGSAVPVKETLKLTAGDELRAQYFCERRELGVINIGGAGTITSMERLTTLHTRKACISAWAPATLLLQAMTRCTGKILFKQCSCTPHMSNRSHQAGRHTGRWCCHRQGLQQSRTRFPGDSKPQNDLQIYPSWSGRELPAGNGHDKT